MRFVEPDYYIQPADTPDDPATQHQMADILGLGFDDLETPEPTGAQDLRRLRGALGLNRAEAAQRLGIEASTLRRVEEGLELPPNPRKIARGYGVTRADLAAAARRVVRKDGRARARQLDEI